MKPLVKFCFVILTLAFLTSCSAGKMSLKKMERIRKGMSILEFSQETKTNKAQYTFEFEAEKETYHIYVYKLGIKTIAMNDMLNGAISLVSSLTAGNQQVAYDFNFTPPPMPIHNDMMWMNNRHYEGPELDKYTDAYAFIFKQDSLVYWGYLEELLKHPNKAISELGDKTEKEYTRRVNMMNNNNF